MTTINQSEKTSKIRKILPAKNNKLLVFGYWLLNNLKDQEKITSDVCDSYLQQFKSFDDVESQCSSFQTFWDDFKIINKSLKSHIKEKIRDNKPSKTKRRRRTKYVVCVSSDLDRDIIGELVADCQSTHHNNDTVVEEEEVEEEEVEEEEEEEEITVQKFMNNNILYLIDSCDNIYDFNSHDEIGKFNHNTKSIDFTH